MVTVIFLDTEFSLDKYMEYFFPHLFDLVKLACVCPENNCDNNFKINFNSDCLCECHILPPSWDYWLMI